VVAPGLAEPGFAVADAKPVDESSDGRAEAVPADVADLGADTKIVGGDLVAVAPPIVLGLAGAVGFPELVVEGVGPPERAGAELRSGPRDGVDAGAASGVDRRRRRPPELTA
jgi:hypothetical protein